FRTSRQRNVEPDRFFTLEYKRINDFGKKEHRIYKFCLEEIIQSPELLETRKEESAKELASHCSESLKVASEHFLVESKRVPCYDPLLTAQSARSSLNPRSLSRKSQGRVPFWREKKLPESISLEDDPSDILSDDNNEESLDELEMEEVLGIYQQFYTFKVCVLQAKFQITNLF
ncbi:7427_t:CDS:2, partial [Acaulospora morrowiae]